MPVGCRPLEIPALALKSVLKPQSIPALYQTKPPNARIMLTSVTWLVAKSETVDIGLTFRAGSNTLRFANYFASGIREDNVGTEMTEVSISAEDNFGSETTDWGCYLKYVHAQLQLVSCIWSCIHMIPVFCFAFFLYFTLYCCLNTIWCILQTSMSFPHLM